MLRAVQMQENMWPALKPNSSRRNKASLQFEVGFSALAKKEAFKLLKTPMLIQRVCTGVDTITPFLIFLFKVKFWKCWKCSVFQ
jgi:hypothetical protein